ncbi:MAG: phosphomannomutase/phosphoglucomutase [Pyrinomonadaceae bacterium]
MKQSVFREYDIRGVVGDDLDERAAQIISRAVAAYFARHKAKKIVVGYDARRSSPMFHKILVTALNEAGCSVLDIGRVPTPVLYFALFTKEADGGVMITGSHNPPNHNGFKISLGTESLHGKQIQEIKKIALAEEFAALSPVVRRSTASSKKNEPKIQTVNILDEYQSRLLQKVSPLESDLKVVVDAGNGMGGVTAVPFYRKMGAEVVELFCEPDSNFPNHEPDPSQEKNLRDLIRTVVKTRADLGIAFDGDADRITIVDETGRIIWGDELMILFAREVLAENPNSTIVAEVKCTQTLFDEIEKLGGKAVMSKAGHSIIKAEMQKRGAILGGEMSGHIFFADRFYGFDDGLYAGARLLEILSKTDKKLSEIFAEFPRTFSTPEIRVNCAEEKKSFVIKKIIEEFSAHHKVYTIDGARIQFENGWGLARPSNTQALLILRFEADSEENLQKIRRIIENKIAKFL